MKRFYTRVIRYRKWVIAAYLVLLLVCFVCSKMVSVNYDIKEFLPDGSESTVSIQLLEEEFSGGIPNARVMIKGVTIPQALEYKDKLSKIEGVTAVSWLDDSVDITLPMSMLDEKTVANYYKDESALYTLTIDNDARLVAVEQIRELIGQDNALAGATVATADATLTTVDEVMKVTVIAVIFVLIVLILTTSSWLEPLVVLAGLGVAIMINKGSNLLLGEISFVTNASGSVLLLAVALDYSVFLLHRFHECRERIKDNEEAMVDALCKSTSSILSSGLTTVIGFLALVLMRFRLGADLGTALAKGVGISLLTVFLFTPALILCTLSWSDKLAHRAFLPSFQGLGKAISRVVVPVCLVLTVLIVPAYLASGASDFLYGSSEIFDEDTRYGEDTKAIEDVFGKSDTYVLMVPKGDGAREALLSDKLHELPQITSIVSFVDLAGEQIPTSYLDESTLAQLEGKNYARMVLSVNLPGEGEQTFTLVQSIRDIANTVYPGTAYLAGEGVSTYDLKQTITSDMTLVNLLAIGAVFAVLLAASRSLFIPVILVLSIETAIWLNLSIPYFTDQPLFYLAYLIISSVQLGATVDYAILMTDRYRENRRRVVKKKAVAKTVSDVFVSIMTSGSAMTVVGFLLGMLSNNRILSQLGILIGRGAIFSILIVLLALPGYLYLFDKWIVNRKVTPEFQYGGNEK